MKITKYLIQSWSEKIQDWVTENKETTLGKANAWAKSESRIMTKTYRVLKEVQMSTFQNGEKSN